MYMWLLARSGGRWLTVHAGLRWTECRPCWGSAAPTGHQSCPLQLSSAGEYHDGTNISLQGSLSFRQAVWMNMFPQITCLRQCPVSYNLSKCCQYYRQSNPLDLTPQELISCQSEIKNLINNSVFCCLCIHKRKAILHCSLTSACCQETLAGDRYIRSLAASVYVCQCNSWSGVSLSLALSLAVAVSPLSPRRALWRWWLCRVACSSWHPLLPPTSPSWWWDAPHRWSSSSLRWGALDMARGRGKHLDSKHTHNPVQNEMFAVKCSHADFMCLFKWWELNNEVFYRRFNWEITHKENYFLKSRYSIGQIKA